MSVGNLHSGSCTLKPSGIRSEIEQSPSGIWELPQVALGGSATGEDRQPFLRSKRSRDTAVYCILTQWHQRPNATCLLYPYTVASASLIPLVPVQGPASTTAPATASIG